MKKVVNEWGTEIDFEAAAYLMDGTIREELHTEGFDSDQDFFTAYAKAHEAKFGEEWELAKVNPTY